jgi:hypothetical protein
MEVIEGLFSEGNEESYETKVWSRRAGILKDSSWQYYDMVLFLKDLLHSQKSESNLHDSLNRIVSCFILFVWCHFHFVLSKF